MKRNDIHLLDYRYAPRQSSYLFHESRKAAWLSVDGSADAHAGITFAKLSNDVIITRGANGVLPPHASLRRRGSLIIMDQPG